MCVLNTFISSTTDILLIPLIHCCFLAKIYFLNVLFPTMRAHYTAGGTSCVIVPSETSEKRNMQNNVSYELGSSGSKEHIKETTIAAIYSVKSIHLNNQYLLLHETRFVEIEPPDLSLLCYKNYNIIIGGYGVEVPHRCSISQMPITYDAILSNFIPDCNSHVNRI